jgi:tetratricopeptide (TPR) repeat protein
MTCPQCGGDSAPSSPCAACAFVLPADGGTPVEVKARGWAALGRDFLKRKAKTQAAECSRKALALDPSCATAAALAAVATRVEISPEAKQKARDMNTAAIALVKGGKRPEAIALLRQASQVDPGNPRIWFNLGLNLEDSGDAAGGLDSYIRACEADPQMFEPWVMRGAALNELKKYGEALACFEKALELKPDNHSLWFNKGKVLCDMGRSDEGLACYDRGLKLAPKEADLWNNKGCALLDLKRYDEALTCFAKTVELNPKHAFGWNNRGEVLNRLGRWEEAIPFFQRALDVKPFAAPLCNRGDSLRHLERYQDALINYDKALERYKDYGAAWYGKALCEDKMYLSENAIASFRRFIALNPHDMEQELAQARARLQELGG